MLADPEIIRIDNMFKWRSQWKSTVMSGNQTWRSLWRCNTLRLVSSRSVSRALVISSHPLFPLLSFWSSVSRLLFSFSLLSSPTMTRTTTTSPRIGVFLVSLPSYCLLFSLSLPPLPSFWSFVSRAIVFFPRLLSFSSFRRRR